jgi:hypothetical protein
MEAFKVVEWWGGGGAGRKFRMGWVVNVGFAFIKMSYIVLQVPIIVSLIFKPCFVIIYIFFLMCLVFALFFPHVIFSWFAPCCHSCELYLIYAGKILSMSIFSYFFNMFIILCSESMSHLSCIFEETIFAFHLIYST